MSAFVELNGYLTVNGVDLSDHVMKCGLDVKAAQIDATAWSSVGWKAFLAGLKEWTLAVDFEQDFAASKVYATLWPLFGTTTAIEVKPVNTTRSATNPSFTGNVIVTAVPIMGGTSVGALSTISVSWPGTGALAPLTS